MTTVTTRVPVRELVELACRAPSVHNTQPWHWYHDGDQLTLFADYGRQLPEADSEGRDVVISCGAALHHLRVAAAATGWEARVKRMPNSNNDGQLADLQFVPHQSSTEDRRALEALTRRRTDRRRMSDWPVARDRLAIYMQLCAENGVLAYGVVSSQARQLLSNLLEAADATQREDPAYLEEIQRWIDRADSSGIPASSLPRHPPAAGQRGAGTRFPSGTLTDPYAAPESNGGLLVVCSSSDDTASRLRAGEALSAILLQATHDGLSCVPLSQATEVERTRVLLQDLLLNDAASPQILVRIGWPEDGLEVLPQTPRRPVDDVLSASPGALPRRLGPYQSSRG